MEPDSLDQHAQVVEKGKVQKGESTGDRYISKGERERGGQVGTAKKLRQRQVLSQFLAGRKGKALRQEMLSCYIQGRGILNFPVQIPGVFSCVCYSQVKYCRPV